MVINGRHKDKSLYTTLNAQFVLIVIINKEPDNTRFYFFLAYSATKLVLHKHTVTTAKEKIKWPELGPRAQLKQTLITTMVTQNETNN